MKKLLLLIWMFCIIQLSSTSGLRVSEPDTWLNETRYESTFSLKFLLDADSEFFNPYQNVFTLNFILHKLSHMVFYSVLIYLFYINFNKSKLFSLIALFLFALSDEIHQYFVIGRSGRLLDVLLDFISAALFLSLIRNKKSKTEKTKDK